MKFSIITFTLAALSAAVALPNAEPVVEKAAVVAEPIEARQACAPAGQESCCVRGFYRVGNAQTNIQRLVPFSGGGLTNIGITGGCSVNIDRRCANQGGCGSWAVQSRQGCNGVEISVNFLDRCPGA